MSNFKGPHKSWKKFALAILGFLPLLFLCDRGLFRLFLTIEPGRDASSSLEDKLNAVSGKEQYEVLVLGTSRAFNAILPIYVNPVIGSRLFKESSAGKGPKYNYYFYRRYRKIMGVPKVVVYGIDYFLFNIASPLRLMNRFPECRKTSDDGASGVSLLLANKNRIDQYINAMMIQYQEESRLKPGAFKPEKNLADMEAYAGGRVYDPSHVVTEIPADFEKKRSRFSPYPGKEGSYFAALLKELKKDNVTILLVTIPDHIGTFRTYKEYRLFIKEHLKMLKKLDYKGRWFLIDYDSPSLFPMDDTDCFINGGYGASNSHLSAKGAKIYSKMFAQDLKKILETLKRPSSPDVRCD
jgi:hypothetical protein